MRRFTTMVCLVGLLGAGAGVALAAMPAPHKYFSGKGGNFWNENGRWVRHGSASFHFTTSGRNYTGVKKYDVYLRRFSGSYSTKCNGTHPVRADWLRVHNGSFAFSFVSSGAHVKIWGNFTATNRANIRYVVNFSGSSTNPNGLNSSCATYVHGAASS